MKTTTLPGFVSLALTLVFTSQTIEAQSLGGKLGIETGSFFSMSGNVVPLERGSAGGITLGAYQNFVLDPDEPHPQGWQGDTNGDGIPDGAAGTGYGKTPVSESTMLSPFKFFGINTYIGTNPISYQSGEARNAPSADVDLGSCSGSICSMTADLSAWEVMWNGSAFEQGPRPDNTGNFVLATGIFNLDTRAFELDWDSQIKGGPFNGVTASWHLQGTYAVPVPAAIWLFISGLMGLSLLNKPHRRR